MQTASNSNLEEALNKSAKLPSGKIVQNKTQGRFKPGNLAHKKEFAMTGNFNGSPKPSGDGIKTVAALHQSEYGVGK